MESDDEVMPVKYLDGYPKLPIDAPFGCPHIIDLDCLDHDFYDSQPISIADLVVTILFKVMPQALTAFLNMHRPKFHYIQAGGSTRLDFCIKRDDRTVSVGFLNEKELGGWDVEHKYRIDGRSTEQWTPVWIDIGGELLDTDTKSVLEGAPDHAYSMFMHEPWHGRDEIELVVDWSGLRAVQVEVALLVEVLLVSLLLIPLLVKVPLLLAEGLGVDDEDDGRAVEVTTDAELDDTELEIVTMDSLGALLGVAFEDVGLDDADTPLADSDDMVALEILGNEVGDSALNGKEALLEDFGPVGRLTRPNVSLEKEEVLIVLVGVVEGTPL
ncbi:MAG: hypothetical protein Q9161_001891 [Pseudevernia consocians]